MGRLSFREATQGREGKRYNNGYLRSKCVDNSRVAEHHQRQWKEVGDKVHHNSHPIPDGLALVYAKFYAYAFHDIRRDHDDRSHICWDDDPDKCDCSIHKILFLTVQLQNVQDNNLQRRIIAVFLCLRLTYYYGQLETG